MVIVPTPPWIHPAFNVNIRSVILLLISITRICLLMAIMKKALALLFFILDKICSPRQSEQLKMQEAWFILFYSRFSPQSGHFCVAEQTLCVCVCYMVTVVCCSGHSGSQFCLGNMGKNVTAHLNYSCSTMLPAAVALCPCVFVHCVVYSYVCSVL